MDADWPAHTPVFGTVVGVVEDVRFRALTRAGRPTVYWYYRQRPGRIRYGARLVVESASGEPALVAGGLREAIQNAETSPPMPPKNCSRAIIATPNGRLSILFVFKQSLQHGLICRNGFGLSYVILTTTMVISSIRSVRPVNRRISQRICLAICSALS